MQNPKILFLLFLIFITAKTHAQLSGKIAKVADTVWLLSNNSGPGLKVKFNKNGQFMADIGKLQAGMYSFGKIGEIYLQPDYKMQLNLIDNQYVITGNGKVENEILKEARTGLDSFLGNPGYAVKYNYLITEPSAFIPLLDDYINKIHSRSAQSSSKFFKDFIQSEVEFGKRYCLYAYNRFYGLDSSKMDALRKILAIPVADRKENYRKELMEAYQAQFSKKLNPAEKELLNNTIYDNWDVNNELFYKNSDYYKEMIGYRIDYLTYVPKNQKLRDSLNNDDLIRLEIAKKLITNSTIRQDFTFKYTNNAIRKAKTPTDVAFIYQSFINEAKNEKYRSEVKKSYQNLTATLANVQAPDFNYVNPEGKMVSLKSLRGKYVYIDVWATWCAPCIAEIPSLKKIAEKYKDKKIQFVSISVDTKAQKNTWLNFVEKNNLKGIQLMADNDFKSDFIQKFGISSIPRFILISPEGVIIDNNAKRPSNQELVKQLDTFNL